MDPSKLTKHMGEDEEPLSPSATEHLTASDPNPFVVTEALSKTYYKGLPSQPPLIATTKPGPFEDPSGPEAYSVLKELKQLGDHPLANVWDHGLADSLRRALNTLRVNWTSIDALRIVEAGQSAGPAVVWIGVEPGALSFAEGSAVARECAALVDGYRVRDCHVEIRESSVVSQALGCRFLDPVPLSDPTFAARDAYTATLGIPIAAKDRSGAEGTAGFYVSAGGDDKHVYLVTARHVVFPLDKDDNKEYERKNDGEAREDVVVLGTPGFNEKLAAIEYDIQGQGSAITDAEERIESVKDRDDPDLVCEHENAKQDLQKAKEALEALRTFRHKIATQWGTTEQRVFGALAWSPPIVLSTEPGKYTQDLAVIKIDAGALDAKNYRGNTINIGSEHTRQEVGDRVHLHPTSPPAFKFPANRLLTLQGEVPERDLAKPPMRDATGAPCLLVLKHGATTGTTFGRANNVPSYTRSYIAGQHHESREWAVVPMAAADGQRARAFAAKGDSGSCVADAFGRVGGIVTGGAGAGEDSDVTYVMPISFIMEVLHGTKRFERAHLNPVLD